MLPLPENCLQVSEQFSQRVIISADSIDIHCLDNFLGKLDPAKAWSYARFQDSIHQEFFITVTFTFLVRGFTATAEHLFKGG